MLVPPQQVSPSLIAMRRTNTILGCLLEGGGGIIDVNTDNSLVTKSELYSDISTFYRDRRSGRKSYRM